MDEMNHELLKATAEESMKKAQKDAAKAEEKEEYTPHSTGMRIFALVLAVIVAVGFALWLFWFMKSPR